MKRFYVDTSYSGYNQIESYEAKSVEQQQNLGVPTMFL